MNQRRRFLMAGGAIAAGFGLSQTALAIGLPSLDTLENDSKKFRRQWYEQNILAKW